MSVSVMDEHLPETELVARQQRLLLRRVWGSLWRHLPALAVSGAVTAVAGVVGLRVAGDVWAMSPLVIALFVGPTLMPLLAVVQGALVDDDTELRRYLRDLPRFAVRSTGYALVPGLCLSAVLAGVEMYRATGSTLALASLAFGTAGSVLAVVALTAVLPASVARPGLRGTRLWATAFHLLGRWPIRFLAPLMVSACALWAMTTVASSLVLLVPVPIALMSGAAYWCCAIDLGARDVLRSQPAETTPPTRGSRPARP